MPKGRGNPTLRQRTGYLCIGLGLLLILASFNGSWGRAYGQTVVTPTPFREADPRIVKTGVPECCQPGDEVTWTIVATNVGNAKATNVVVRDTIPPQLTLRGVTTTKGVVTISGNSFEVAIGTLFPGEVVTIVATAVVNEGVPPGTVVTNTAYLYSDQGNREASDDVLIREPGGCGTPPHLPPTGQSVAEPEGGTSLWILLAGVLLLLVGIVLTVRARTRPPAEEP